MGFADIYRKGTEAEIENLLKVAPQIIEPSTAYGNTVNPILVRSKETNWDLVAIFRETIFQFTYYLYYKSQVL